jgi:hypothetical protein
MRKSKKEREKELVLAKIEQMFTEAERAEVLRLLAQYGQDEREAERVHLAILKLCGGDKSQLQGLVEAAKVDYRDVLLWAEYPGQIRSDSISPAALREIIKADRKQYRDWLLGKGRAEANEA